MPSIAITTKKAESFTVTEEARELLRAIYDDQNKKDTDENMPKIKVSDFVSKMSFYYEKIRNSVDYKEEHLLRKNAIERILKREILIQGAIKKPESEKIARHLLQELIRGAYLPNDKIPETKISETAFIIKKYTFLKELAFENWRGANEEKKDLVNRGLFLMACDIEERLGRKRVWEIAARQIYENLVNTVKLADGSPHETDRKIQIFIGVHRRFLKFDDAMLGFILFKHYTPGWGKSQYDENFIRQVARNLPKTFEKINEQINHPLRGSINKITARKAVFFSILIETATNDAAQFYAHLKNNIKEFELSIKAVCDKHYSAASSKLWRAGIRSVIYIFLTKSLLVFALEIPIENFFGSTINNLALFINLTFPAALLFLIIFLTRVPSQDNTKKIISGIEEIVYQEKRKQSPITLSVSTSRGKLKSFIFSLLYAVTFLLILSGIVRVLQILDFNWLSIIIFLFFLAFVSYFSIRVRKSVVELRVLDSREGLINFIADFFYMPIALFGKWLSEKFSQINVFVFVLDFIIESPFKLFVEITEEWAKYVKERRENI